MKKPIEISENEKWEAVVSCDKNYDGLFFYGVKTTGIFCRPSCRSKTPIRTNVIFFDKVSNAIETGFRPCKRCCPDKMFFNPDLELVKKAMDIFHVEYNKSIDLSHISKQLGVSTNHFIKLFKQYSGSGLTPTQYITRLRVFKAVELIKEKDTSIIDIVYMTGFKSLSNFYKHFKEHTKYTPNEYRVKDF